MLIKMATSRYFMQSQVGHQADRDVNPRRPVETLIYPLSMDTKQLSSGGSLKLEGAIKNTLSPEATFNGGTYSRTPSELQALDYHKMTLATCGHRKVQAFNVIESGKLLVTTRRRDCQKYAKQWRNLNAQLVARK